MAGIIAVYGLVVSVLIVGNRKPSSSSIYVIGLTGLYCAVNPSNYSLAAGFIHLGAGISCGTTGIAAGYAIGHVGDSVSIESLKIEA
jgi:V-type H+-transporting ATPase proteolipid subunit